MNVLHKFYTMMLCSIVCFALIDAKEKVLIFTQVYNRPDFIELHAKTFKAFMQDEYEYVVFNDANDPNMQYQIERTCSKLGIRCFKIPYNPDTRPGWRHIAGIKYSFETIGFDFDGIVMLVDSDMFLVKPFSANKYMEGYDLIGGADSRENDRIKVSYLMPTLVFINMKTAPNKRTLNFYGGHVEGLPCDVGGHTYYYLKNNPTLRYRLFTYLSLQGLVDKNTSWLQALGFDDHSINFIRTTDYHYGFQFHAESYFMHYYAGGSNWPGYSQDYLHIKNVMLHNYIDTQMRNYHVS